MALSSQEKDGLIKQYQRSQNDTGSPEIQTALLSARIDGLTNHFKTHKSDVHSRQGLLRMVNRRRKLLDYVKGKDVQRYRDLISQLGLRK